jgi:arylsulfatase A-like enzyme
MAEGLSELGFLTAGVTSNTAFLTEAYQLDQGFQHYDDRRDVELLTTGEGFFPRATLLGWLTAHLPPELSAPLRTAEEINESVFDLLGELASSPKPFFLFVNYMDAHFPYLPALPGDSVKQGFEAAGVPLTIKAWNRFKRAILTSERPLQPAERHFLLSRYDAAIRYLDHHIGLLLQRLTELGVYDETMIIVLSDHGEAFGDRQLLEHGVSVYQDLVHVPLIIKYPYQNTGQVISEPVSHVDILPTIFSVLDHSPTQEMHGRNLQKLEQEDAKYVVSESYPFSPIYFWHPRFDRTQRALISGELKLVRSTGMDPELYDIESDPDELANRFQDMEEKSAALAGILDSWLSEVGEREDAGLPVEVDDATRERLRALGYLQ